MSEIDYVINGSRRTVRAGDDDLLLDVLREQAGITSAREGCGVGACGACTVLVGGHSVSSCLARAVRFAGAEIQTADGLPPDHPVVAAFVATGAMQCGYCIPGFVLMVDELLRENPRPTREEIVAHLEGNICRCGTYAEIIAAAELAAERTAAR